MPTDGPANWATSFTIGASSRPASAGSGGAAAPFTSFGASFTGPSSVAAAAFAAFALAAAALGFGVGSFASAAGSSAAAPAASPP